MCHTDSCQCAHGHKSCDCGQQNGFKRRFRTREERIEELEAYLADLQAETRAVNEQIETLKAA